MLTVEHRRMRRAIEAYVDGELSSPARIAAVRAHLDECWDCSSAAEALWLMKRSLRRLAQRRPSSIAVARLQRWIKETMR